MKRRIITNFTDFGNRKWIDRLHGGKADEKTPDDFDADDIEIGTAIEREHTNNPDIATEISLDHDTENDTYYDELIMSGIADEKDAINTFNKIKTKQDKKIAIDKIQHHLNIEKEKLNDEETEDEELNTDDENFDEEDRIEEKFKLKKFDSFIKK